MLRFEVYRDGEQAGELDLSGAYLFGQDSIPVRSELSFAGGRLSCVKRVPGACGLSLLWQAGQAGIFMLPTTRLPERPKPYNLNVELARGQLTRLSQKREDWGLFDYSNAADLNREFDDLRALFVEALAESEESASARLADQALERGIMLGEKMALFHADIFLNRRRSSSASPRVAFGCLLDLFSLANDYQESIRDTFDMVSLPMPWKHTEPKERQYHFGQTDAWVEWATRHNKPIHAGPLLSFEPAQIPEWLFIWEHDYDTLRDMVYEHIQRLVRRYHSKVKVWKVVSGIHAHNSFNLNFEQLMELTRMSCLLVKRLAPSAQVMVELLLPWGEYYARNQRTIPPALYADMCVQSGVKFDCFGTQVLMGAPVDGHFVRDLMQISGMLDEFVGLGKPLHISACQVPSDTATDPWDAWGGKEPVARAEWLQAFSRVAISKPFVESVCWRDLADYEGHYIPHGGLCLNNLQPKLAYRELRNFRASLATSVVDQQRRTRRETT
jgi:hypothetical protein